MIITQSIRLKIKNNLNPPSKYYTKSSQKGCFFVCFLGVTTLCGCIFHSPIAGFSLLILKVSWTHKMHHSQWDSSGRVINPSQRPLPVNTQHSQQTNIHAPGGIWTHSLSRQAAIDLRLRPYGHWDLLSEGLILLNIIYIWRGNVLWFCMIHHVYW